MMANSAKKEFTLTHEEKEKKNNKQTETNNNIQIQYKTYKRDDKEWSIEIKDVE